MRAAGGGTAHDLFEDVERDEARQDAEPDRCGAGVHGIVLRGPMGCMVFAAMPVALVVVLCRRMVLVDVVVMVKLRGQGAGGGAGAVVVVVDLLQSRQAGRQVGRA